MKKTKAHVFSPQKVGTQNETEITRSLRGLYGKNLEVEFFTDNTLIAGILVKIGSKTIDLSVKNLIERS